MSLIVQLQQQLVDCKIQVAVGDTANRGTKGTLKVSIAGHPSMTRQFDMIYPAYLIIFDETPRDGNSHSVVATVTYQHESNSHTQLIQLCDEE